MDVNGNILEQELYSERMASMKKLYLIKVNRKALIVTIIIILTLISYMIIYNANTIRCSFQNTSGKLAIIIDDFGQSREGVEEMMRIDEHLTFAVMPFLEFTEEDAKRGKELGYEIIIHLPMEANKGKLSWLGPKPILCGMKKNEIRQIVEEAAEDVPYAIGANIHMGSKACCQEEIMESILEVVKEKKLYYFVDSRTAKKTVAKKKADEMGILCYDNNVFLDGQMPKSHMIKRLRKAGDVALKKGQAIAIGHVGIEGGVALAEAIEEMQEEFAERRIELVFVSELDDDVY